MHTTVPSSAQAVQKGSQWSLWSDGHPSLAGFSEKVTAWQPTLGHPPDLGRRQFRVPQDRAGTAG